MPADKEEIEAAIKDGVIFKELLLPVGFSNGKIKCQKMKLGDIDKDKRRKVIPIENEFEYIEIDTLITAIGESVDTELLNKNKVALNSRNKVDVNKVTNETSIENAYIGGDALRGPSTVVESISDGKKAAEAIIKKENININFNKDFSSKFNLEKRIEEITKNKSTVYISDSNKSRCLECNIICNKCIDVCPNRANVAIKTSSVSFTNVNQILHLDGVCNECGNCETFCPHQGAPYRDKVTLFRNKEDFDDSKNEGFYLTKEGDTNIIASIRFRSFKEDLVFTFDGKLVKRCSDESDKAITKLEEIIGIVISNYSYLLN